MNTGFLFIGGVLDGQWIELREGQICYEAHKYQRIGEFIREPGMVGAEERICASDFYVMRRLSCGCVMALNSLAVDQVMAKLVEGYRPGIALPIAGYDIDATMNSDQGRNALYQGAEPHLLIMKV